MADAKQTASSTANSRRRYAPRRPQLQWRRPKHQRDWRWKVSLDSSQHHVRRRLTVRWFNLMFADTTTFIVMYSLYSFPYVCQKVGLMMSLKFQLIVHHLTLIDWNWWLHWSFFECFCVLDRVNITIKRKWMTTDNQHEVGDNNIRRTTTNNQQEVDDINILITLFVLNLIPLQKWYNNQQEVVTW
jgi:hypothetical protein